MTIGSSVSVRMRYSITIMSLCSFFLFYKYILQIFPSIVSDSLMREFHLTGAGLGNLAATFYYTYMIAQLFVGILLDKLSNRFLMAAAIFSCSLGALCFSQAHTLFGAEVSRAFMGVGVAFATVGYMKAAATWFQPRHYATVSGLLATAAMAGAVFGEMPISLFVSYLGWRPCMFWIAILGFILALFFVCIVRDKSTMSVTTQPVTFKNILTVLANKQNWLLTLYSGLAFSPVAVFAGLWGNPFLQQAYDLSKIQATTYISLIFIGLGIGAPIIGFLSDYIGDRRNVMICSTLCSAAAVFLILYFNTMPIFLLAILLFTFGFGLGAFMLVYAMGKELNHIALTATVIAMINASEAVLDSIMEPGIGWLLDLSWDGKVVQGLHYFSLKNYQMALTPLFLCLVFAALLLFSVKDTVAHKGRGFDISPTSSIPATSTPHISPTSTPNILATSNPNILAT